VLWQQKEGTEALTPLWISPNRGVIASIGEMIFLSGALLVHTFYLPYWFQAVRGRTSIQSGIDLIPYVATNFVFPMITGIVFNKTSFFTPPAILGRVIASVGCGHGHRNAAAYHCSAQPCRGFDRQRHRALRSEPVWRHLRFCGQ
jgi:hypothetical protein